MHSPRPEVNPLARNLSPVKRKRMEYTLECDPASLFTATLIWHEPEPGLRLGILRVKAT